MKILLAVSGGLDSMTMSTLAWCAAKGEISYTAFERFQACELGVAHCNFHLRPEECDLDADLVETWAKQHGLAFHRADFDTSTFAAKNGVSLEMAARELRYRFFADCCVQHGYEAVSVAHNAEDNAETLLLNLLRGCGLKGAQAMAEESVMPYSSLDGKHFKEHGILLIRPLLTYTRAEIEKIAVEKRIPYREDSSNAESFCKRNILRNQVFPILKNINPSFVQTLGRDIENFRRSSEALEHYADLALQEACAASDLDNSSDSGSIMYDTSCFPSKAREELLYRLLSRYGFGRVVLESLKNTGEARLFFSRTHRLVVKNKRLIFSDINQTDSSFTCEVNRIPYRADMSLRTPKGTTLVDAASLPENYILRTWEKGDWFCPLGMNGKSKKLSDLFTDLHYTPEEKKRALVLAKPDSHHILALVGERIDESVKVTPGHTQEVLVLTLKEG